MRDPEHTAWACVSFVDVFRAAGIQTAGNGGSGPTREEEFGEAGSPAGGAHRGALWIHAVIVLTVTQQVEESLLARLCAGAPRETRKTSWPPGCARIEWCARAVAVPTRDPQSGEPELGLPGTCWEDGPVMHILLWLMLLLGVGTVRGQDEPGLTLEHLAGPLYVTGRILRPENSMVYVGKQGVTVIGATWTPETARLLHAEIRRITGQTGTQRGTGQPPSGPCRRQRLLEKHPGEHQIHRTDLLGNATQVGGCTGLDAPSRFPSYPDLLPVLPRRPSPAISPARMAGSVCFRPRAVRTRRTACSSGSRERRCSTGAAS